MRFVSHLLSVGVLLASASIAAAKPAVVLATVNLRAAPGTTNEILAKIPGGDLVDADNCTKGWCAVTWHEKRGFAIQTALDLSGHVPRMPARPPGYRPRGYVVAEPPVYYDPPPDFYYDRIWRRRYWRRGWW